MKLSDSVSQLRKGALDLAVLSLLARAPTYGGALLQQLGTAPALAITEGTLYPLLSRLRSQGLVTASWEPSPVGPPRKYYALTARGHTALAHQTVAWHELVTALNSLLEEK